MKNDKRNLFKLNIIFGSKKMILFGILIYCLNINAINIKIINSNSLQPVKHKNFFITGTITDERSKPIPFATISLKGTASGCVASKSGTYSIRVSNEKEVLLEVRSVGYISKTVRINGRKIINVILKQKINQIKEVVTTGYQTISKERATGSFGKVSKQDLAIPSISIKERINGKLTGVNMDGDNIYIRGIGSLKAGTNPLLVIDGFPTEGHLSDIDPNDIADITVLKDAAAASIWGAKASNGVIVVSTKRGEAGGVKVEFNSVIRVTGERDVNYERNSASNKDALEYIASREKYSDTNPYFTPPMSLDYTNIQSPMSLPNKLFNDLRQGYINQDEFDKKYAALEHLDNTQQIRDAFLQNPLSQQYNVRISGGLDSFVNSLSVTYGNNKESLQDNSNNREIINYRNRTKINKWLGFDFSTTLRFNNRKTSSMNTKLISAPSYNMLKNPDGSLINMNYMSFYQPALYSSNIDLKSFPYPDWSYNPITDKGANTSKNNNKAQRFAVGIVIKPFKGLSFRSSGVYEHSDSYNTKLTKADSFEQRMIVNETSTWITNNKKVIQNMPKGDIRQDNRSKYDYWELRNQLNFNKTFGSKHSINSMAGIEMSENNNKGFSFPNVFGYNPDDFSTRDMIHYGKGVKDWLGNHEVRAGGGSALNVNPDAKMGYSESNTRLFSMYFNTAYTYNKKYTLSFSVRNDAANIISNRPAEKYNPFWSVGGSWHMQDESFLKSANWIDKLTLRATVGEGGNYGGNMAFKTLLGLGTQTNNVTGELINYISTIGNPDLGWERTLTTNLAVDFSFFHHKLHGSIEVYKKSANNLIVNESFPSPTGSSSHDVNDGKMWNKGIELNIGSTIPILKDKLVWSGNFNLSYNTNKVTKMYQDSYSPLSLASAFSDMLHYYVLMEGGKVGSLWSYRYAGVDDDKYHTPMVWSQNHTKFPITKFYPESKDGRPFMVNEGVVFPPLLINLYNNFRIFKKINLSVLLTGKFGSKYRSNGFNYPPLTKSGISLVNSDYSKIKNSDPSKRVPIPTNNPRYAVYGMSCMKNLHYLVHDASVIRLQQVNLSYTIPERLSNKIGLSRFQVYAQGASLANIFFNSEHEDPEYPKGTSRPRASYTLGVKITL